MSSEKNDIVLRVKSLSVKSSGTNLSKEVDIIKNISFEIKQNEFFTIIGENGSGKSTLALALTRLLPMNTFSIKGEIFLDGIDILNLTDKELSKIRKEKIGYIFQNPFSSFDPLKNIEFHFNETLPSNETNSDLENHFERLRLPKFSDVRKKYPHQLSGGMLQRISAIRTIIRKPILLIADEPTSALDKPLINLFFEYLIENIQENSISTLLITQDLAMAKEFSDKVGVLKDGSLIETLTQRDFLVSSSKPQTENLFNAYRQTYLQAGLNE
ncbi:MAG: ATP-binding cassette domain-containing protein [Ignavibacteria bacterium]|nr:ATP-binding cassette domain-containing protein [Ignavibacteria bacterium]